MNCWLVSNILLDTVQINKLLLNTDSGDLFHLFVYKISCYNHLHESGIQLAIIWRLLFCQMSNYH